MPARKLSVVIPALNEERTVAGVVEEMLGSPFVSEIIVADNGSNDGTGDAAKRAGATVIQVPERGFGRALKAAFAAARESLIFKIDGDMRNPDHQWVGDLLSQLGKGDGLVKAYWSNREDPMPVTNLVVRPLIRRLFPSLAGIRMPIAGIYLVDRDLLDLSTMTDVWPFDVEVLLRVHRAGRGIQQRDLGEVLDTYKPIDVYRGMAWELISFLLNESGSAPADRLLLLVAHPDDAEIWCGGTLLKYLSIGTPVTLVVLTGDEIRRTEAARIWSKHPLVELVLLGQPEFSDGLHNLPRQLSALFERVLPTLFITHHPDDLHADHRRCFEVAAAALMMLPRQLMPRRLLTCNSYYERHLQPGSFQPDIYVDISVETELKYRHIGYYSSQDTPFWIEMARRLDEMNGFRSGVRAAEAFQTWRFYNSPRASSRIP